MYEELLEEVYEDYSKMSINEYSTLRRLVEVLSEWDQPDFYFSEMIKVDDNGDIYIQDIKCFNIHEEYGIFSKGDAIFVNLKENNVIGNKRLVIVIKWRVGISQIYFDWLDDEYDEKSCIMYERE